MGASRGVAAFCIETLEDALAHHGQPDIFNTDQGRLWRSVKYEEVYLRAYETVGEARHSIGRYLDFYNGRRPHSSLDDMTPDQAYFNLPPLRAAA